MANVEHSKADLGAALESVLGPIDTNEAALAAIEAVCQALGVRPDGQQPQGAVDESRMLRRILQATQEYLLLAPDDSVDYDALLTRVRSALGGR